MYHVAFEPRTGSPITDEALRQANIVARVRLFVGEIPAKSKGAYVNPTPGELNTMRECAHLLMTGASRDVAEPHANRFNYTVTTFYDHVMDRELLILHTRAEITPRGWGMFVFSPRATSEIVVEAPHPIHDQFSDVMAAQGFQAADARALFIAGAHRHAVKVPKDGEVFHPADVAHNVDTMFHAVHLQALETLVPAAIVQFHGYEDEQEQPHNVVVSAGLEKDELAKRPDVGVFIQRIKDELIAETAFRKLDGNATFLPNEDRAPGRMGTENLQGHATHAKGIPFLHVETAPKVRKHGETGQWNVRSTSRLALTVMDVVHRHYEVTVQRLEHPATFGFDRNEYPGATPFTEGDLGYDGLMASCIHSAPFTFVGYHLESAAYLTRNIDPKQRWTGHRRKLQMLGWEVEPLYIGREYQAPELDLTDEQRDLARADAEDAVALARAEGFGRGTVVHLDVENTYERQPNLRRYIEQWLQTFAANSHGFIPGVYCSHLSVEAIVPFAPLHTVFWAFDVACGLEGPSPGCRVGNTPQAFPSQGGLARAQIWQYARSPHDSDASQCLPGALGEAYSTNVPAANDAADRTDVPIAQCWTRVYGTHIGWTAEVDLNVRRARSLRPPVIRLPVPLTPIWLELLLPHTDYPNNVVLRVSIFNRPRIIVGPPPAPEPPHALRSLVDAVVLACSAVLARLSRQPESRPATRLLLTLARKRIANVFRGGRRM